MQCIGSRGLTEDSSHRQDEQLQQRVLLLIGQTQEAQLGHFGEVQGQLTVLPDGRRTNHYKTHKEVQIAQLWSKALQGQLYLHSINISFILRFNSCKVRTSFKIGFC